MKPFHKMHALRGGFDDPRFHLGAEGALSAFHFGVDVAARDGTPVYAVAPGYVRRHPGDITVRRPATGRAFGYWHVKPVVRTGQHVRLHQLLGYVAKGWGHVHFAESVDGVYRNPLRKGALQPFRDKAAPVVASIGIVANDGGPLDAGNVRGMVDLEAEIYDTPPVRPRTPWQVARLAPSVVWWKLLQGDTALTDWCLVADFSFTLMPGPLYPWLYAPGTYQNKANRPGRYLFWLTHQLDTTALPDGRYRIAVLAEDTRFNLGSATLDFTVANGGPPLRAAPVPGMRRAA